MMLRSAGKKGPVSHLKIGLYAIFVRGKEYSLSTGSNDAASLFFQDDAGKGAAHRSIHLEYNALLVFKLDGATELH